MNGTWSTWLCINAWNIFHTALLQHIPGLAALFPSCSALNLKLLADAVTPPVTVVTQSAVGYKLLIISFVRRTARITAVLTVYTHPKERTAF